MVKIATSCAKFTMNLINKIMVRNIYDDNTLDINDLSDLPEGDISIDILAKEGNNILFEMGEDFWKLKNGELYQFPDFVSLRDGLRGEKVYSDGDDNNKDYAIAIINTLDSTKFENLPDFSLSQRTEYISDALNPVTGSFRLPMKINKEENLRKKEKIDRVVDDATKNFNQQELKPITDLIKSSLSVLSLFLLFSKKNKAKLEKENLINKIIRALDNKDIKINDLLEDRELQAQLPELKEILSRYKSKMVTMPLDKEISKLMDDESLLSIADQLSENSTFNNSIGSLVFKKIENKLNNDLEIDDVKEMVLKAFDKSPFNTIDEFTHHNIIDNLEEFYYENKTVTSQQYNLAGSFINACINEKDKNSMSAFVDTDQIDNLLDNITNVIKKIIDKNLTNTLTRTL